MFRILTVCTGNICRSPAAELLLSAGLGPGVEVSSAGTGAVVGHPVEPDMLSLLRMAGVPDSSFAARQINAGIARQSDLILALTTEHRSQVVQLAPSTLRRAFTLLEFSRIVSAPEFPELDEADVPGRLEQMVKLAAPRRRLGAVVRDDDVPDPYRRDTAAFVDAFELISDAVEAIRRAALGEK